MRVDPSKRPSQLLEVTAYLRTPIVLTDELHLDGLLMSAHPLMREHPISRSTPAEALSTAPIPIASLTWGGATAALCSTAHFPDDARTTTSQATKRRDPEDVYRLTNRYNPSYGRGKDRMRQLPVVVTPSVSWLGIGDRRGVSRLCRRISHIGGWRSAGYGEVIGWDCYYVDSPPVAVLVQGGVAMRHLPKVWCQWGSVTRSCSIVPPYWHPARATEEVVLTGIRCAIESGVEARANEIADPDAFRAHRRRHENRAFLARGLSHPRPPAHG